MDPSSTDPIPNGSNVFQSQPAQDESSVRALHGDTLARGVSADDGVYPKSLQGGNDTVFAPTARAPAPAETSPTSASPTVPHPTAYLHHHHHHHHHQARTSNGGSLDKLDAHRPWYKRRRNWPVVAALSFLTLALTALMAASAFMYQTESSLASLAQFTPAGTVANYLAMEIKVSHLNLDTGIGRVTLSKIMPYGSLAIGAGSSMLKERVEVFVNGNQFVLEAGMPAREIHSQVTLTAGQVTRYPYDKHLAPVSVYAMTTAGRQTLVQRMSGNQPLTSNPLVPIKANVVGGVQSLVLRASMDQNMAAIGLIEPQVRIERSPLTKLFGVLVFCLMWGLTGAMVVVAVDVVRFAKEVSHHVLVANAALLVAVPGLRAVQPGIGGVGTTGDVMGFFWNMVIIGITFIGLGGYAAFQTQTQHQQNKQHKSG